MIKVVQTCEMCGKARDLPMRSVSKSWPAPENGGWRVLTSGSSEVTLCNICISIVVEHAQLRARMRLHRGEEPEGQPLRLQFSERAHE